MNRWNWGPWHKEDSDLPPLGAFIQLKIAHIETTETRVLEGTVSEVNDSGQIELIPQPVEDVADWGWAMWRARIVPMKKEERKVGYVPA